MPSLVICPLDILSRLPSMIKGYVKPPHPGTHQDLICLRGAARVFSLHVKYLFYHDADDTRSPKILICTLYCGVMPKFSMSACEENFMCRSWMLQRSVCSCACSSGGGTGLGWQRSAIQRPPTWTQPWPLSWPQALRAPRMPSHLKVSPFTVPIGSLLLMPERRNIR